MKTDNLVYIKLGYDESVVAKRDVLKSQMNAIKIAQSIKSYKELRTKEVDLKVLLSKKSKEFSSDLRKLKALLPKLKVPKILEEEEIPTQTITLEEVAEIKKQKIKEIDQKSKKKQETKKEKPVETKSSKPKHDDSLEAQLREIQGRLNSLG